MEDNDGCIVVIAVAVIFLLIGIYIGILLGTDVLNDTLLSTYCEQTEYTIYVNVNGVDYCTNGEEGFKEIEWLEE